MRVSLLRFLCWQSDFGGHDNVHHDQLFAYVGKGFSLMSQPPGVWVLLLLTPVALQSWLLACRRCSVWAVLCVSSTG